MSFHVFYLNEIYSDSTGRVQYIEFVGGGLNGQHVWAGHQIISSNDSTDHTYNITKNLPSSVTSGKSVLVATQGYANLGLAKPDYVVPNDFLFLPDGSVNFPGMTSGPYPGSIDYTNLPNDGVTALNHFGTLVVNSPKNFAGTSGKIPGVPYVGENTADQFTGTAGKDFMVLRGGADTADGGLANDTLRGGTGDDSLLGGDGNDRLEGSDGNDVLDGGMGNDNLIAGIGNDTMDGGAGTDTLTGGDGADLMVWGAGDVLNGGAGVDKVKIVDASVDLSNNTANPNTKLVSIEQFDLTDGDHTLKLSRLDVLAMSPTDSIRIFGDAGDTVEIVGAQSAGTPVTGGFLRYKIGATGTATFTIDADITVI